MANFDEQQWQQIFYLLQQQKSSYRLPERRSNSLVFSSFNIRKFGRLMAGSQTKRSAGAWQLLEQYAARCDFLAIQEVMDDLSSLRELKRRLGTKYSLLVSDTAGVVPGRRGAAERLAFLFRNDRIEPTGMAADISFERSEIFRNLYENRADFAAAFETREEQLQQWEEKNTVRAAAGKRKLSRPPFVLPHFVQFMRTPHLASFQTKNHGDAEPYRFVAVNAHLLYGDKSKQREERWMEFKALLDWLLSRARDLDRVHEPNLFLFGDLNLDLEKVDTRRRAVEEFLTSINERDLTGAAKINLPFLDAHPTMEGQVFRTNARRNQTYDQVGLIARDKRLPPPHKNDEAGELGADGYDFGMFDFVQLFLDAVPEASKPSGKPDYRLFEYDVSDHMPIWFRLPRPADDLPRYRWR